MTKQTEITASAATATNGVETVHLPLEALTLSKINPRQGDLPEGDVETLAQSIRVLGLLQNLSGYRNQRDKVEIVAGGRRLRALQHLAKTHPEHPALQSIAVQVTNDKMVAEAWAGAENSARADLHPADEILAYGRMAKTGAPAETIATAFAVSEAHVKRRLKLANLSKRVLDALKDGKINLDTAQSFTMCTDAKRVTTLLEQVENGDITNQRQLRAALMDKKIAHTDRRVIYVTLEAYKAAGGKVTEDLFSEEVYVHDAKLLDDLFTAKIEAETAAFKDKGWKWAEFLEVTYMPYGYMEENKFGRVYPVEGQLSEDEAEEYDALAELAEGDVLDETGQTRFDELTAILDGDYSDDQRDFAGVVFYIGDRGNLNVEAGLIRKENKDAAIEAGILPKPHKSSVSGSDAPRSPYSQALAADLTAIRLAACQTALLEKPEFVLDLLAFFLSPASGHWSGIMGLRTDAERNRPKEDDPDFVLHHRLGGPKPDASDEDAYSSNWHSVDDLVAAFAEFREEGKKHRNAVITERIARLICTPSNPAFMANTESEVGANIRTIWTPTQDNFFSRVKGPYMIDLWCTLLDLDKDGGKAGYFAKLKAKEKQAEMHKLFAFDADLHKMLKVTKAQAARIKAWVPDCMV